MKDGVVPMTDQTIKAPAKKKKRLSKGQRIHVRRVKQESRSTAPVSVKK
jgi:hypothetical protein